MSGPHMNIHSYLVGYPHPVDSLLAAWKEFEQENNAQLRTPKEAGGTWEVRLPTGILRHDNPSALLAIARNYVRRKA